MDPLEALGKLAVRARQEPAPAGNVSADVLARIGAWPRRRLVPLSVFAAAAAVAATVILALGITSWVAGPDPVADVYEPIEVHVPW